LKAGLEVPGEKMVVVTQKPAFSGLLIISRGESQGESLRYPILVNRGMPEVKVHFNFAT